MNKNCVLQPKFLFTLILVVCSALLPMRTYAQNATVTIRLSGVAMQQAMNEIEKQTDYLFLSNNEVNINNPVNIDVRERPLSEALNQMLRGTDFTYTVDGKYILLQRASQQPATVMGVITDNNGAPVPGASVSVKGTSAGAFTASDGSFTLRIPATEQAAVIVVNYLGYEPVEMPVGTRTEFRITLKDSVVAIDNVVVTALGIKRSEKALSYSAQQVTNDDITTVKSTSFINSLAGKVAGAQINANANGAGGATKVVLRGTKSITRDNNALYVIDGIPMNNISFGDSQGKYNTQAGSDAIADLNPDDIESITVLSGPSAAALYGTDSANGAILITTRKGAADRTTLSLSNSTMFSTPFVMPDLQNTYGNKPGEYASWGNMTENRYDPTVFFNTGSEVTNSLTFSSGNANQQVYVSAAATNAADILPNSEYDRYNFSTRYSSKSLNDRLTVDLGANFVIQYNKNMVTQGLYFTPLPALYTFARGEDFNEVRMYQRYDPTTTAYEQYWPYGLQGAELQNPYWIMNNMRNETSKKRYMFNASVGFEILDWLSVSGRASIDNSHFFITEERDAGTAQTWASKRGYYAKTKREDRQFYGDAMFNVDKSFGDFNLSANVGGSIKDIRHDVMGWRGGLRAHYNVFSITNIETNNYKDVDEASYNQMQSIFANAELSWRNMLYLTLTGRNDWPSALYGSEESSFFYPSAGLSAIVTEMADMPEWVSFLKLRGSLSEVGSSFSSYLTIPYLEYNDQTHSWNALDWTLLTVLKPELTTSWELGVSARFLRSKLYFDFTYYSADTRNQTFRVPISKASGYDYGIIQGGKIRNSGIELLLGFRNTWNDFTWASSYTLSQNKNVIKKLMSGLTVEGVPVTTTFMEQATLGEQGSPKVLLFEGGSMGDIYIDRELKRDMNGNIYVNSDGGVELVNMERQKIGTLLPKAQMGWSNTFSYKGIDLSILFSARIGGNVVSNTEAYLDYFGVSQRSAEARDNGGIDINGQKVDAQKYYRTIGGSSGQGGHYVYGATNVRLQELSVSYTLPTKWFGDKMRATFSLIGRNLWMIYNEAPFDPELVASTTSTYYTGVDLFLHPSVRNIGFSVKLQF